MSCGAWNETFHMGAPFTDIAILFSHVFGSSCFSSLFLSPQTSKKTWFILTPIPSSTEKETVGVHSATPPLGGCRLLMFYTLSL